MKPHFAACFVVVLAACGSAGDGKVRVALDQLRAAPQTDTVAVRKLIDALKAAPAEGPVAKQAQATCSLAYTTLIEGREAIAKAKADEAGAGESLKTAIEKASAAKPQMEACNKASVELTKQLH